MVNHRFSLVTLSAVLSFALVSNSSAVALSVLANQTKADDGVTALMRAARDGEREDINRLLAHGVAINARDAYGWTALKYAAANGDSEIVKRLLDNRADINASDEEDQTPLMAAAIYRNFRVVKILIEKGADLNRTDKKGDSALTKALRAKDTSIVEALKGNGAVEIDGSQSKEMTVTKPEAHDFTRPVPLNFPQPRYTTKARKEGIQGTVRARVLVDLDGTVKRCRILTGLPYGLTEQAIVAANEMRFKPASKAGQSVAYVLPVEIEFRLRSR